MTHVEGYARYMLYLAAHLSYWHAFLPFVIVFTMNAFGGGSILWVWILVWALYVPTGISRNLDGIWQRWKVQACVTKETICVAALSYSVVLGMGLYFLHKGYFVAFAICMALVPGMPYRGHERVRRLRYDLLAFVETGVISNETLAFALRVVPVILLRYVVAIFATFVPWDTWILAGLLAVVALASIRMHYEVEQLNMAESR